MKEKILLALSDQALLALVSKKLSDDGYVSITAKTGEEALAKMASEKPDLALIDLILPGKDGYQVLNEKSFDRFITKIPVIVVSNSGMPVEMKKLPSTSNIIKDYLIRVHIDPSEVLEKVKAVFGDTSKPAEQGVQKGTGKKILWVEDDKFLSSILFKKFESSGHKVLPTTNGEEALELMEKEAPDLIIMDVLLPGMNGFEILEKIKANPKYKKIPVIVLSNLNKPSDIEKAKVLGAQKFLVKVTVSLNEITKEVDALLK